MNITATTPTSLPWRRSVGWLLLLGPFFFLSYGFANQQAAHHANVGSLFYAWERLTPFWPWTIVPYWSIDLLYGLSFLCCRTPTQVDRHGRRLLTAQLIAVACFLAFPLRFAFERPAADGFFGSLFTALTSFDLPYNQAPSLHIALLVLIWTQFARFAQGPLLRWVIHGWALLIGVSVLTTWQHHAIDVPTGAALGFFCLWLWPDEAAYEASHSPLRRVAPIGPAPRRLAGYYGMGATLALGLAVAVNAASFALTLLLGWLALALALVAWGYAWAGATVFQKQDGRATLAATWLFAPYTLAAWVNSRLWTHQRPQADQIADDVWLGRLPTAAEMRAGGFVALCDLTAELPAPRGAKADAWAYVGCPWLDLVPPDAEQLRAAARSIDTLRQQRSGPLLVACALGYSRSAAAVAAWLYLSGRCVDMTTALALLAERRPVIINPALQAVLRTLETEPKAPHA